MKAAPVLLLAGAIFPALAAPGPAPGRAAFSEVVAEARRMLEAGRAEEAVAALEEHLRFRIGDAEVLALYGRALAKVGWSLGSWWRSIQNSTDAAEYFAYLARFPDGVFADLARNRLVSISTPVTDRGTEEVAAVSGTFGAIAMSIANWRRVGVCTDMSNQQAANECAMAKCGHNYCQVHVEIPAGQCAAVVAGHFATAATQSDAMEEAKRECWRERGRASDDCRRRVVTGCNG